MTKIFLLLIFTLFGVQCTPFERGKKHESIVESPVMLDLNDIIKRGYIRAIVENSPTSYYIYKGRRMGFEFEMLRNLAGTLGVRLHLIVKSDLVAAHHLLNSGGADIIAMNLEKSGESFGFASFIRPEAEMHTVIMQQKPEIAWAVRKNAPVLKHSVDEWIETKSQSAYFKILYEKYFLNSNNSYFRNNSSFSSISGNRISNYDDLIKKGADALGWDWRLLASLVYKESRFDTTALSYAGAVGLLQLMPVTLERFGVENPNDPLESLMGGVNYLRYLDRFWRERVPETNERIKFILASYNIGHGHVQDAWKLTMKYGKDIQSWKDVSHYLKLKSDPQFYLDPIVKSGYAKGHLAVSYVEDILIVYDSYRALVKP